jgi:hypothetical protein
MRHYRPRDWFSWPSPLFVASHQGTATLPGGSGVGLHVEISILQNIL